MGLLDSGFFAFLNFDDTQYFKDFMSSSAVASATSAAAAATETLQAVHWLTLGLVAFIVSLILIRLIRGNKKARR